MKPKPPPTPDHWIGKTNRIASVLFAKVPRIHADPHLDALDRCWLFTGNPGNGKTSLALALAATIGQHHLAIEHVNGQSCTIDLVRDWRNSGACRPLYGSTHVKVVDEIDAASPAACNELRTYLDLLPPYTVVIATTNKRVKELQEQLQSRFEVWRFDPIPSDIIGPWIVEKFSLAAHVAAAIAKGAEGNMRTAIAGAKEHLDCMEAA